MSRFDYVRYDEQTTTAQIKFKAMFEALEKAVDELEPGRAQSLAHTHLEEAYMWVGKSLRDRQIKRNGGAELAESRVDA